MITHWELCTRTHANHEITLSYRVYNHEIQVTIDGPRASSINKDVYVEKRQTGKVKPRFKIFRPSDKQIQRKAENMLDNAVNRIDTAIAEHAKKHGEEYQ